MTDLYRRIEAEGGAATDLYDQGINHGVSAALAHLTDLGITEGKVMPHMGVIERMVNHFLISAKHWPTRPARDVIAQERWDDMHAIAALLAPPVDPDILAAREAVCRSHHDKHPESPWHVEQARRVRYGERDNMLDMLAAIEGVKSGRKLGSATQ